MIGVLVDDHPLLGRIPRLTKPHIELAPEGTFWGFSLKEIATKIASEGLPVPARTLALMDELDVRELLKRGARPGIAGAGQQESYRALGASFAITSTIHAHLKLLGGSGAQATLCMAEASFDGASGIATLELDSSTEASAGTAGSAPGVTQVRRYPAVTPVTTASGNYSAEGTTYTAINVALLPMPTSPLIVQYPLGRELETQPTATTNGKALLMRMSTTVNCNGRGMLEFEE